MREIIPQTLWLGNVGDARDLRRVLDAGIMVLIDLAEEELPPRLMRDLVYCRFPIVDGAGNSPQLLQIAVNTVAGFIRDKFATLVYSGAGMSRAPAIVAAALARENRQSPDQCLQNLLVHHAHDVAPQLWQEILNACFPNTTAGARK